jgi:hypothetical protein
MADFFESEFSAGVLVGGGATGLAVALAESPTNWLFVAGTVVTLLCGLAGFYMLKARSNGNDDF